MRHSATLMLSVILMSLTACAPARSTGSPSFPISSPTHTLATATLTPTLTTTTTVAVPTPADLGTPQESPASPDLPPSSPGWVWYRHVEGVRTEFAVAYPQSWEVRYSPGAVVSFISPETMSLVEVHMWRRKAAEPDFDLLEWVNDNQVRVLFRGSKDPITYNAEMLGRPAMFHYSPASGGTPDMSMVVFAAREHCFRITFYGHSYSTTSRAWTLDKSRIDLQLDL